MGRLFCSWDIETVVDSENSDPRKPMKIFLAAVAIEDASGGQPEVIFWDFTKEDAPESMLYELITLHEAGYTICTVNGAGFDYHQLLNTLPDRGRDIANLCRAHFDPTCVVFCQKGYPVGLDALATTMVGTGKVHDVLLNDGVTIAEISGKQAWEFWQRGEESAVKNYLTGDVLQQLGIARSASNTGELRWKSGAGKSMRVPALGNMGSVMLVKEALGLPVPDTSWMKPMEGKEPMTRQGSYSWMDKYK